MSNSTTTQKKMTLTQDLREAIANLRKTIGFDDIHTCQIRIDNSIYNDCYGDEVYPLISLIDSSFTDVIVTIENEFFVITDSTEHEIAKIPLSAISDINYLYDDNCFYLVFVIEKLYCADIVFNNQL